LRIDAYQNDGFEVIITDSNHVSLRHIRLNLGACVDAEPKRQRELVMKSSAAMQSKMCRTGLAVDEIDEVGQIATTTVLLAFQGAGSKVLDRGETGNTESGAQVLVSVRVDGGDHNGLVLVSGSKLLIDRGQRLAMTAPSGIFPPST